VGLFIDLDPHQGASVPGHFQCLRDDQRQRLTAVQHLVVEQGAKRLAIGSIGVLVGRVVAGHGWTVLVMQHGDHARYCQRRRTVDGSHATARNRAADHAAMQQARRGIFARIARRPCYLGGPVDAVQRLAV